MTVQLMLNQLVFIPKALSLLALIGLILFGIAEFRRGHIGRLGIAGNDF